MQALVSQSKRAYTVDPNYYLTLIASLEIMDENHRKIDSLFLMGLLDRLTNQWGAHLAFNWEQMVICFTWASMMLGRFQHL